MCVFERGRGNPESTAPTSHPTHSVQDSTNQPSHTLCTGQHQPAIPHSVQDSTNQPSHTLCTVQHQPPSHTLCTVQHQPPSNTVQYSTNHHPTHSVQYSTNQPSHTLCRIQHQPAIQNCTVQHQPAIPHTLYPAPLQQLASTRGSHPQTICCQHSTAAVLQTREGQGVVVVMVVVVASQQHTSVSQGRIYLNTSSSSSAFPSSISGVHHFG